MEVATLAQTGINGGAVTAKQQLFVAEYLVDLNATQAAIRAGYSQKTARAMGHENLTKPDIEEAIAEALKERRLRTEITQDRVLEELAAIGFAEVPEETDVRVSDKLVALDKLAKHLGMFTERIEHSGEITSAIRAMSDEEILERATDFSNRLLASVSG